MDSKASNSYYNINSGNVQDVEYIPIKDNVITGIKGGNYPKEMID